MQVKWLAIPIVSALAVLSSAPAANATSLVAGEEPVTQLVQPSPSIFPMTYVQINNLTVSEPITSTPLLCGTTSAPGAYAGQGVSPIYYSPTGLTSLKPFVFGASAQNPAVPAAAPGASMMYGSTMHVVGDPSLVCYGLDANGVHSPTPDVLRDQFEGVNYSPTLNTSFNSSVVLTVFHVPTSSTDFYGYTIDVTVPAKPANVDCTSMDCNFALLEGFDSAIFDTAANADHTAGWCLASAGATSCPGSANAGGINLDYRSFNTNGLPSLTASGASPTSYHFVVKRFFRSGVTALPSDAPVALAALFSPFDFDENFIADNVAVGYGNSPPAVVQSGDTWSLFTGKIGALAENTNSGSLAFNITDSDTAEGANPLTAAVTLNLNGLTVPVTPTCTLTSSPGVTPVNRQCTFGINLADAHWWDSSVSADYQGQGNAFATDPGNVSASARITVTDSLGKSSAPVVVALHTNSTANNAPAITAGVLLPGVVDPKNSTTYPTYTCSVSAAGGAGGCGLPLRGSLSIDLVAALSATPGPAAAFDELASQTTAVVPFTDPGDSFTNVQCVNEQQAAVFAANGGPIVSAGAGTSYDMDFVLPATAPTASVSTLCTLTITDQSAAFPAGQTAKTTASTFRIVVNP